MGENTEAARGCVKRDNTDVIRLLAGRRREYQDRGRERIYPDAAGYIRSRPRSWYSRRRPASKRMTSVLSRLTHPRAASVFSPIQLRPGATCKHVTDVIGSLNGATRQGWPEIAE